MSNVSIGLVCVALCGQACVGADQSVPYRRAENGEAIFCA